MNPSKILNLKQLRNKNIMRNLILAVLLVGLSTIALAAENPAQKPAEKTTKDLVVDTFSEFYENLYNISKK